MAAAATAAPEAEAAAGMALGSDGGASRPSPPAAEAAATGEGLDATNAEGAAAPRKEAEDPTFLEWAAMLWLRMDRDGSGFLTRDELDCDEFQRVLRSVVAPSSTSIQHTGTYSRSEQNVSQAINFCLRKADQNSDGRLSFDEFKAFLRVLRNQGEARQRANLIFALFDLDGSNTVDKDEFKEIFRYFQGRAITTNELNAAWLKLDPDDLGYATRARYARWLRSSADPVFRQLAPPMSDGEDDQDLRSEYGGRSSLGSSASAADLILERRRRRRLRAQDERSEWNPRFNNRDTSLLNEASPKNERTFFSRPQSLPELSRYCDRHKTRLEGLKKVLAKPVEKPRPAVLSTDTARLPKMLPGRYEVGGTMRDRKGQTTAWRDDWQPPGEIVQNIRFRPRPGSLMLRCAGKAPEWAVLGKDYDEDDAKA